MRVTERRTERILNHLQKEHYAEWCSKYGEPGYQDPESGVVFCNWNDTPKWVGDYLEEAGYECEWSDEWCIDYDHGKAYRIAPDCYHWEPSILFTENGDCLTPDDPIEEWVAECEILGPQKPHKALPSWIRQVDLVELGWQKYNGEFETGWHPGQTDDPKKVAEILFKQDEVYRVVFRISENSQFYTCWEAWWKGDEDEDDS